MTIKVALKRTLTLNNKFTFYSMQATTKYTPYVGPNQALRPLPSGTM